MTYGKEEEVGREVVGSKMVANPCIVSNESNRMFWHTGITTIIACCRNQGIVSLARRSEGLPKADTAIIIYTSIHSPTHSRFNKKILRGGFYNYTRPASEHFIICQKNCLAKKKMDQPDNSPSNRLSWFRSLVSACIEPVLHHCLDRLVAW